jgi:serine/threonine protein kinase
VQTAPILNAFPQAGEVLLEKYAVDRVLGEGGMGAVIQAQHLLRRVPVALKFIHPNVLAIPGAVERFYNEAVAASRISNEHVVQIFDVDRLPSGVPFIVMEFLAGHDLAGAIDAVPGRTLSVARATHITIQTLRALAIAHRAGVVHRDLKPSNVFLVDRDGEPDFVKLVDFGISKVRSADSGEPALTQVNSTLGTPLYMAPEQARSAREVDARSDLYSVAVILYEMLAGRTPYVPETGELTEILYKLFTTEPPPLTELRPDLDPALAAVVACAMQKNPEQRFETAGAFAAALAPFADERSANELQRLRQAELAAGGVSSEAYVSQLTPATTTHVRVRSAGNLKPEESFAATHLGTEVGQSGPILVGRGHTEAVSSRPQVHRSPRSRAPLFVVGAVVAAAIAAFAMSRRTAAPPPNAAPIEPEPPVAHVAPPPVATPSAAPATEPAEAHGTPVAAPVVAIPAATTATARPRPATPFAPASPAPPATKPSAPAGKPRLNDLGITD